VVHISLLVGTLVVFALFEAATAYGIAQPGVVNNAATTVRDMGEASYLVTTALTSNVTKLCKLLDGPSQSYEQQLCMSMQTAIESPLIRGSLTSMHERSQRWSGYLSDNSTSIEAAFLFAAAVAFAIGLWQNGRMLYAYRDVQRELRRGAYRGGSSRSSASKGGAAGASGSGGGKSSSSSSSSSSASSSSAMGEHRPWEPELFSSAHANKFIGLYLGSQIFGFFAITSLLTVVCSFLFSADFWVWCFDWSNRALPVVYFIAFFQVSDGLS